MSLSSLGLLAARADEKSDRRSRQYKIGAGVLGGAALYYGLKKKNPIGATAAGAAAYYAYRKSQEEKDKSRRDRYGYNYPSSGNGAGDVYPDDNGGHANGGYADGSTNGYPTVSTQGGYDDGSTNGYPPSSPRGGYDNGTYASYPRDASGDDNSTPDNNGAYSNGDYAQNGSSGKYPVYGFSSQHGHRSSAQGGSSRAQHHSRRVVTR